MLFVYGFVWWNLWLPSFNNLLYNRPNMLCLNRRNCPNPRPTKHVVSKPTNCPNPKPTIHVVLCLSRLIALTLNRPSSMQCLNFALAYSTTWTNVLMPTDFAYCYFPPQRSNQTKLNLILIVQRKPNLVPFLIIQKIIKLSLRQFGMKEFRTK